ncbi:hypothetical protein NL676_026083 [Syzygium grande]|nr:hypothetical protein NL676_026083 [Syzygium grande]
MAGISSGEGRPLYGGAVPFRSHQGLVARAAARSDEMVLQIDLEDGDGGLDQEVGCLRGQVHQLRNQSTLIKARAGLKNNVRRLHKSIVQYGSNNVVPIIVFALICIFLVYLWPDVILNTLTAMLGREFFVWSNKYLLGRIDSKISALESRAKGRVNTGSNNRTSLYPESFQIHASIEEIIIDYSARKFKNRLAALRRPPLVSSPRCVAHRRSARRTASPSSCRRPLVAAGPPPLPSSFSPLGLSLSPDCSHLKSSPPPNLFMPPRRGRRRAVVAAAPSSPPSNFVAANQCCWSPTVKFIIAQPAVIQVGVHTKSIGYISGERVVLEPKSKQTRTIFQASWDRSSEVIVYCSKIYKSLATTYFLWQLANKVVIR